MFKERETKEEKKVIHEVKFDKSIIKLLWVFAVVLLINALPKGELIPQAYASQFDRLNSLNPDVPAPTIGDDLTKAISSCWKGAMLKPRLGEGDNYRFRVRLVQSSCNTEISES